MRLIALQLTGGAALAALLVSLVWIPVTPTSAAAATATPIYKDPRAPIAARVDDLLSRMTIDEEVAQITRATDRSRSRWM